MPLQGHSNLGKRIVPSYSSYCKKLTYNDFAKQGILRYSTCELHNNLHIKVAYFAAKLTRNKGELSQTTYNFTYTRAYIKVA